MPHRGNKPSPRVHASPVTGSLTHKTPPPKSARAIAEDVAHGRIQTPPPKNLSAMVAGYVSQGVQSGHLAPRDGGTTFSLVPKSFQNMGRGTTKRRSSR